MEAQKIANVQKMLETSQISIPATIWFSGREDVLVARVVYCITSRMINCMLLCHLLVADIVRENLASKRSKIYQES
jgi:hypothetical protein